MAFGSELATDEDELERCTCIVGTAPPPGGPYKLIGVPRGVVACGGRTFSGALDGIGEGGALGMNPGGGADTRCTTEGPSGMTPREGKRPMDGEFGTVGGCVCGGGRGRSEIIEFGESMLAVC
jgi:hypothetical protein